MVAPNSSQPVVLFGTHGRTIILGESLGSGREGSVHVVDDLMAAKVFRPERLRDNGPQTADKVMHLMAYRKSLQTRRMHQVLWPISPLLGEEGKFAGYLMPRVVSPRALHRVARNMELDPNGGIADRMDIATQLVEMFCGMHRFGIVIGDVSSNNVLVGDGMDGSRRVYLIDVDSVRIPGSPSGTRTPRYVRPKELRGELPVKACVASDLHALAYLLFEVFMRGASPYAHVGGGSTEENTQKERFPYQSNRAEKDAPPLFAPYWAELPKPVREALVSCFSSKSLTANEWRNALRSHQLGPFNRFFQVLKTHIKGKWPCRKN